MILLTWIRIRIHQILLMRIRIHITDHVSLSSLPINVIERRAGLWVDAAVPAEPGRA